MLLEAPAFYLLLDFFPLRFNNESIKTAEARMEDYFILKKKVDRSVLMQGMSIPGMFQPLFYEKTGITLGHGETRMIKVSMNGTLYEVNLKNQGFDRKKYETHPDVLQLRYDGNRQFLEALRAVFASTWKKAAEYRAVNNTLKGFRLPKGGEEFISFYATPEKGVLFAECLPDTEYKEGVSVIKKMEELAFEAAEDNASYIETKAGVRKIRHLSRSIGNSLKELYGYRCQICGAYIGENYGSKLIHAHHIDYFTKSLNNNSGNILIVCPNHHYIIHDTHALFNRKTKEYEYPNGYKEGLKLNKHI